MHWMACEGRCASCRGDAGLVIDRLGFIICEIFTVITLQDWVGWGIFTVIPGYPRRASGDSQHFEARRITGLAPVRII